MALVVDAKLVHHFGCPLTEADGYLGWFIDAHRGGGGGKGKHKIPQADFKRLENKNAIKPKNYLSATKIGE